jgi:putative sulfotransferase
MIDDAMLVRAESRSARTVGQAPAFVVCTGRCGSTLVSNMIRLHPDMLSLSEFFLGMLPLADAFPEEAVSGERFWELLSRPKRRWTLMLQLGIGVEEILYEPGPGRRYTAKSGVPPLLLMALPHLTDDPDALFDELGAWVPTLDARPVGEQYRRLFTWISRRLGKSMWLERSGGSLNWLDRLLAFYPDARFVHLYRDGRDCAISTSRHNGFKLGVISDHLYKRLGVDPYTSEDAPLVPPPASVRPFMPETFERDKYRALKVPVEDMGREWSNLVLSGCRTLEQLESSRLMHLRFETLVAEPESELRRLARFLGASEDERWLASASELPRPTPPRWLNLPAGERRRLIEACAPGMQLLYGTSADPVGPEPAARRGQLG